MLFFDPPYSFRKREEEAESGPSKKSLLSDTDTDQQHPPPPNNSPLPPADEQNIRNILNLHDPHRNLSYIIEGCVQKNSKI